MMSSKVDPRARRRARRALLQALYQAQLSGADAEAMCGQFRQSGALDGADTTFFDECLHQILRTSAKLDEAYRPFLDRSADKLGYVERGVLSASKSPFGWSSTNGLSWPKSLVRSRVSNSLTASSTPSREM